MKPQYPSKKQKGSNSPTPASQQSESLPLKTMYSLWQMPAFTRPWTCLSHNSGLGRIISLLLNCEQLQSSPCRLVSPLSSPLVLLSAKDRWNSSVLPDNQSPPSNPRLPPATEFQSYSQKHLLHSTFYFRKSRGLNILDPINTAQSAKW